MRTQRRTNKDIPCPLCGRIDGCMLHVGEPCRNCDGSGNYFSLRRGKSFPCFYCVGGVAKAWVYCLREQKAGLLEGSSLEALPPITSTPIASADVRDRVYSQMLLNTLKPHHRKHLLTARQLSEETIDQAGFASVPLRHECDALARELAATFDLSGVPGFFQKDDRWCLYSIGAGNGLYIPLRDSIGRVIGMQVRCFGDDPKRRYFTLSGAPGSYTGANAGAPWHWAKRNKEARSLVIVDGILKSYVVAEHLHSAGAVVGLVSHSTPGSFWDDVRVTLPSLRLVLIGFDYDAEGTDARRNTDKARDRVAETAKAKGYAAQVMQWDAGKGLDDFLLAENTQKIC